MSKKQMGFTLIEIVMVLVLLGILAAVAVPKYFDLRAQAEQKAAQAIVAEGQARVTATFAKNLLDGKTCTQARTEAVKPAVIESIADGWALSFTAPADAYGNTTKATKTELTHTVGETGSTEETKYSADADNPLRIQSIEVPTCADTTTKSEE